MAEKNRLQRFIELHREAVAVTTGDAREIHESFLELGLILQREFDKKRDKHKTEIEKILGGEIPSAKTILYLKNPSCAICGYEFKNIDEATIDHIKPLSMGGSKKITNKQLACPECNVRKSNFYDPKKPNGVVYLNVRQHVRFMLEESNFIEGVRDKEALNDAFNAWRWLLQHNELTTDLIKKTHMFLMRNRGLEKKYVGAWRDVPVSIGGKVKFQSPALIESLMQDWCKDIKDHQDFAAIKLDHIKFEDIHPFIDGNGRMGRILMNWQLVKHNKPLCVILDKEKQAYYKWFRGKEVKK
jgi:rubredoxin